LRFRIRVCLYCIMVLLAVPSYQAFASISVKAGAKPSAVLTTVQAETFVNELVPLVEQYSGRKFITPPIVKLTTANQVAPVLARELIPQYRRLFPGKSEKSLISLADANSLAISTHLLGKYGTYAKILYIVPENFRPRMQDARVDPKHEAAFVKLIIAHELTHALQDQYVGLASMLNKSGNTDQSLAVSSTIEGHAIYVQDKIANELNMQDSQKEYDRAIGAGVSDDPVEKLMGSMESKLMSDTYLAGRDFITWQMLNGGPEQVWKVLSAPPVKSSMILHPETYAPTMGKSVDYKSLLSGVEKSFGPRKWNVVNVEVGEMQLRALYNDLEPTTRDAVLTDFDHAQALAAMDGTSVASVTIIAVKDPKILPKLITGLGDVCKKNVENINREGATKIKDFTSGSFTCIKSDANSMICFKMTSGAVTLPNKFVRVVRGRVVVEIYCQAVEVSDVRLGAIAESIFKKLPLEYCKLQ